MITSVGVGLGLVVFGVLFFLLQKYKPEIEYIHQSEMWVMFYTKGFKREYFIIFKK